MRSIGDHHLWIAVANTIAGVASYGDSARGSCDAVLCVSDGSGVFGPAAIICVDILAKAKGFGIAEEMVSSAEHGATIRLACCGWGLGISFCPGS